jgi:hypothetical protein
MVPLALAYLQLEFFVQGDVGEGRVGFGFVGCVVKRSHVYVRAGMDYRVGPGCCFERYSSVLSWAATIER